MDELCPVAGEDTEAAWRDASRAGELLDVIGPRRLARMRAERDLVDRVRDRLRGLVEGGKLAPAERVEAGRVLGRVGDPRFREDAWYLPAGETLGFVRIPAGTFWMGSDKKVDKEAFDDELPRHRVTLPEVWMARYPVTVAEWRAFVDVAGFIPGDLDSVRGTDNEPVRWVSWHEAAAYAEWLDGVLRGWPACPAGVKERMDSGYRVRLPGEAEWERVARGVESRIWPWGNTFEPERLNGAELGLRDVSPVGCFPAGATPEAGILDMAGNVWEWARGEYKTYPFPSHHAGESVDEQELYRALRGGSFAIRRQYVRCAFRNRSDPRDRDGLVGFRLVLSPF